MEASAEAAAAEIEEARDDDGLHSAYTEFEDEGGAEEEGDEEQQYSEFEDEAKVFTATAASNRFQLMMLVWFSKATRRCWKWVGEKTKEK